MDARDGFACLVGLIESVYAWLRGKMTSQAEAVGSVISATCMSEGFWKCDRRFGGA